MTTLVQIPTLDDNDRPAVQETTLLAESTRTIDENDPRGMVVYAFSSALREIILQSRYWGRIKAYVMFAISRARFSSTSCISASISEYNPRRS